MKIIILFIFALYAHVSSAQIQFQYAIGGPEDEVAFGMDASGHYIVGVTNSYDAGNSDMYLVKLNDNGTLGWTTTLGGLFSDNGKSVINSTSNGIIVAGQTYSYGSGDCDGFIAGFNYNGTFSWCFAKGGPRYDVLQQIIETKSYNGVPAEGYAICGNVESDSGWNMYVYSSTPAWTRIFGDRNGYTAALSICQDPVTKDFCVAGSSTAFNNFDEMLIVCFSESGQLKWSRALGGIGVDIAYSVIATADHGFAVAGETNSFGAGGNDFYIAKLNGAGVVQWAKTVGGPQDEGLDGRDCIIQTPDGGFVTVGETGSFGAGPTDMYIVKLSSAGDLLWTKTVGAQGYENAESVAKRSQSPVSYIVSGTTTSFGSGGIDLYVVGFDSNWNTCSNTGNPVSTSETHLVSYVAGRLINAPIGSSVSSTPIILSGGNLNQICVIGINPISSEVPASFRLGQNFPNPFNPNTKFIVQLPENSNTEISVYDITGKKITTIVNQELSAGTYEINFDGSNYSSGIYFYSMRADNYTEIKKMILLK